KPGVVAPAPVAPGSGGNVQYVGGLHYAGQNRISTPVWHERREYRHHPYATSWGYYSGFYRYGPGFVSYTSWVPDFVSWYPDDFLSVPTLYPGPTGAAAYVPPAVGYPHYY